MYVDIFNHILPKKYQATIDQKIANRDVSRNSARYAQMVPSLVDLDYRFRIMDHYPGYVQVLTVAAPPVETIAPPDLAEELCQIANDELAELVLKYPQRFPAAIGHLPANSIESAIEEAERCVRQLRMRGVQLYSDVNGNPLDSPELFPLYEKMEHFGLPILIHPKKSSLTPDYAGESESKYRIWTKIGWPQSTALAMTRLVYGEVFVKFPKLKFVVHHCGGFIPFLAGRITWNDDFNEMTMGHRDIFLPKNALAYYRENFFYDTAVNGCTAAVECTRAFCGIERMVFATDAPFCNEHGNRLIRDTIKSVNDLPIGDEEKQQIFAGNATKLLKLPLTE